MATTTKPWTIERKFSISGRIVFETAWHLGSGREGQTMSDLGVLLDLDGAPLLPGSSLKGKLRSTCESLAHALNLRACLLDHKASGIECASDIKLYSKKLREEYKAALGQDLHERLGWIDEKTCDVCKLFGSPVRTSKIRCGEGRLQQWAGVVQVRDGVVIDRDSHTAVNGLKYDYEVVPPGTAFAIRFDLDNPTNSELALLGAALFDWHAGSSLGGGTSRGLGRFRLDEVEVAGVDFSKREERVRYLTSPDPTRRLTRLGDLNYFAGLIQGLCEET